MRKKYKKRLLDLATHLEKGKLIHETFDFKYLNYNNNESFAGPAPYTCGTAGCALGEMPAVSKSWNFDKYAEPHLKGTSKDPFRSAEKWFDISESAAEHLFNPNEQNPTEFGGKDLNTEATAKQVAANIRAFVKKMEAQHGKAK